MTTDDPAAAVREAAATYGIDLDEAGVDAYAEELANTEALVGDVEPDLSEAEPVADVREGDDPHDAFLYRFETDPPTTDRCPGSRPRSRTTWRSQACR